VVGVWQLPYPPPALSCPIACPGLAIPCSTSPLTDLTALPLTSNATQEDSFGFPVTVHTHKDEAAPGKDASPYQGQALIEVEEGSAKARLREVEDGSARASAPEGARARAHTHTHTHISNRSPQPPTHTPAPAPERPAIPVSANRSTPPLAGAASNCTQPPSPAPPPKMPPTGAGGAPNRSRAADPAKAFLAGEAVARAHAHTRVSVHARACAEEALAGSARQLQGQQVTGRLSGATIHEYIESRQKYIGAISELFDGWPEKRQRRRRRRRQRQRHPDLPSAQRGQTRIHRAHPGRGRLPKSPLWQRDLPTNEYKT